MPLRTEPYPSELISRWLIDGIRALNEGDQTAALAAALEDAHDLPDAA